MSTGRSSEIVFKSVLSGILFICLVIIAAVLIAMAAYVNWPNFVARWTAVPSPLFREGDVKAPVSLAIKLRDARDAVSRHIRKRFSEGAQRLLSDYSEVKPFACAYNGVVLTESPNEYDKAKPSSESVQVALIDELNRLIRGERLYHKQSFAQVTLSEETQRLLKNDPEGKDLIRLNRLLLEDAYPNEIAKSRKVNPLRRQIIYAIKLSLVTSSITVFIALCMAVPSAYALSRYKYPAPRVIDTILDIPIVMPPVVAGVALLILFSYWQVELVDWLENSTSPFLCFLADLKIRVLGPGTIRVHYTREAIVLAQLFIGGPFAVRALKAAFDDVDPRFEAVARTLGCTRRRAFLRVTLPLARNGLIAGAVMTWARAIGEFGPIIIFCSAKKDTAVLPIAVFLNISVADIETGVVISIILVVLAAASIFIFKSLGGKGYFQ